MFRQESGIRNSRRDSTQEWAMSGQVQELRFQELPRGVPGSGTSQCGPSQLVLLSPKGVFLS